MFHKDYFLSNQNLCCSAVIVFSCWRYITPCVSYIDWIVEFGTDYLIESDSLSIWLMNTYSTFYTQLEYWISVMHCNIWWFLIVDDRRVGPLVMFVKKWAKFQNINSAKDQTISSYALTLMVLHYLQYGVRGPPVLPSLQSLYPVSDSGGSFN